MVQVLTNSIANVQTFIGKDLGDGPRLTVVFPIDFTAGGTISADLNLGAQLAAAKISFFQSLKVDNTFNAAVVDIYFNGSQDHVRCPPNSIGVYQVNVSNPPNLTITCSGGTGVCTFALTNVLLTPTVASTVSVTSPFIFNGSGYALVSDPILDGAVTAGVVQVNIAGAAPVGGKVPVADAVLEACVTANVIATSNAVLAAIISGGKLSVADSILDGTISAGAVATTNAAIAAIISGGKLSVVDSILDGTVTAGAVATTNAAIAALITGGALTVVSQTPGGTPTSRSLVTVATTSTQLMAANAARKYFKIAAPQTQGIWLNFIGGAAAPNGTDSYFLGQGQIWETSTPEYVTQGKISYYSTAASLQIAAEEA